MKQDWVILAHAKPDCTGDFYPATIPGRGAVMQCSGCGKWVPASTGAVEAADRMREVSLEALKAQRAGADFLGRWVTTAEEVR